MLRLRWRSESAVFLRCQQPPFPITSHLAFTTVGSFYSVIDTTLVRSSTNTAIALAKRGARKLFQRAVPQQNHAFVSHGATGGFLTRSVRSYGLRSYGFWQGRGFMSRNSHFDDDSLKTERVGTFNMRFASISGRGRHHLTVYLHSGIRYLPLCTFHPFHYLCASCWISLS